MNYRTLVRRSVSRTNATQALVRHGYAHIADGRAARNRRGQPLARRPRSRGSSAVEVEGVCASCMEPEDGEEEEAEEREEGEG
ncbi:hypothetical protein DMN91_008161, partial [Ooceraea biroi]